jgi:hypothetical protein
MLHPSPSQTRREWCMLGLGCVQALKLPIFTVSLIPLLVCA